jgi:hypothetical protein
MGTKIFFYRSSNIMIYAMFVIERTIIRLTFNCNDPKGDESYLASQRAGSKVTVTLQGGNTGRAGDHGIPTQRNRRSRARRVKKRSFYPPWVQGSSPGKKFEI